jgi:hypothetical protein
MNMNRGKQVERGSLSATWAYAVANRDNDDTMKQAIKTSMRLSYMHVTWREIEAGVECEHGSLSPVKQPYS